MIFRQIGLLLLVAPIKVFGGVCAPVPSAPSLEVLFPFSPTHDWSSLSTCCQVAMETPQTTRLAARLYQLTRAMALVQAFAKVCESRARADAALLDALAFG